MRLGTVWAGGLRGGPALPVRQAVAVLRVAGGAALAAGAAQAAPPPPPEERKTAGVWLRLRRQVQAKVRARGVVRPKLVKLLLV